MKPLLLPLLALTAFLASSTSAQDDKPEVNDGVDFCRPENKLCLCDDFSPVIDIVCDGTGLHSLFEEADWNVTLTALNATSETPLYVTFIDNSITHVPRFPKINITLLSLQQNKISKIDPFAFAALESLVSLNLAHNELNSDSFANEELFMGKYKPGGESGYYPLPLERLNLSYNKIHSIPKYTFDHFDNLISLDLSFNPLETLEGNTKYAIGNLLNIEFLGLSGTSISGIPGGLLHDLNHLVSLDLSNNLLTSVPKELSQTHILDMLDLSGNLFKTLDKDSFEGLGSLENLVVSNVRPLTRINEYAFSPLKNLTKVVITFNPHLKEIDEKAFSGIVDTETEVGVLPWPVKQIMLNDNGLAFIHEKLANWSEVDYIDIQNNPFWCDCNLGWMVLHLVDRLSETHPALTKELFCSEPQELKGKALNTLTKRPELFKRCQSIKKLVDQKYDPVAQDPGFRTTGVTILVIGTLLVGVGLSLLAFLAVKRRAITQSLISPSQIRYERADTEDGSEWRYSQPSSIYK